MNSVTIRTVATPVINKMFDYKTTRFNTKCVPSSDPNKVGKFVDWGTKLYEMELQLQDKNEEIEFLRKKMNNKSPYKKKYSPQASKPRAATFKEKCMKLEKKIAIKVEENKWEKEKGRQMAVEINKLRAELRIYKPKRTANRGCQTEKKITKSVQTQPRYLFPTKRHISTQCVSPTVKVTIDDPSNCVTEEYTFNEAPIVDDRNQALVYHQSEHPVNYVRKPLQIQNNYSEQPIAYINKSLQKESSTSPIDNEEIEYATAVSIKGARKKSTDEPLEMSLVQKFGGGKVQTLVKSNEKFHITEQAVTVPNPKQINKAIEALHKDNLHVGGYSHGRAVSPNDSGVFEFSRPATANSETANQKRVNSAKKILFPKSPNRSYSRFSPQPPKQITFERTLPRYLNGTNYHVKQHPSTPALYTRQPNKGCHGYEVANSPVLFRRSESNRVPLENQPFLKRLLMNDEQKKPVYLHSSQIQLYDK